MHNTRPDSSIRAWRYISHLLTYLPSYLLTYLLYFISDLTPITHSHGSARVL